MKSQQALGAGCWVLGAQLLLLFTRACCMKDGFTGYVEISATVSVCLPVYLSVCVYIYILVVFARA
jgi:hypothetical protein